ncbi:methyl-accepting chemotaxis protein [Sphingobium algorifonticola]|uniref:Methyl-accepting chemotaxis protein n=1 Tax=Sphingobium algorifonticola TaxID=2008318 RepID=A0A437JBG0_9SPHN|nr:methyl-accepting chemotaxis protein [Sphingobium algorifonticola]RVT43256.1 methyl-accepting chemotaxis protein [Sphingobium algorifonticola]
MTSWLQHAHRFLRGEGRSLGNHVRIVVAILVALLLFLTLSVFGASIVNQNGLSRLVENRLVPISTLQHAMNGYGQALVIANKVQSGNMTPQGGASAVDSLQGEIAADWVSLAEAAPEKAGGIAWTDMADERARADAALVQLARLLQAGDADALDFFLSGTFYTQVGPLLMNAELYIRGLRDLANAERDGLRIGGVLTQGAMAMIMIFGLIGGYATLRIANRRIVEPLGQIAAYTASTAMDEEADVPGADRSDEIGDIARAIGIAATRAREARQAAIARHAAEANLRHMEHAASEAAIARASLLDGLFARFGAELSHLVDGLAAAAASMRAMAEQMTQTSASSEIMASRAAQDVEAIAQTMGQMEAATGTLRAIIRDVDASVDSARVQASSVHAQSQHNRTYAHDLRTLVQDIGGALDQITGIAQQTNMLALNAGIEASRAGDAGRGFAVVAQEVKALARQTQAVAGEIGQQLHRIAATSDEVLESVSLVERMAAGLDGNADRISEAVATQSASSREIVAAMDDVRRGSRDAAGGMADLQNQASDVRAAAHSLLATADDIARKAHRLRDEFTALSGEVRAAA